jgi:foldase protein PrsA
VGDQFHRAVNLETVKKVLVAGLCAALVSAGCGDLLAPAAAVVYEEKITVDEVTERLNECTKRPDLQRLIQQGTEIQAIRKDCEQSELSRLIRRVIFERNAERLDVGIDESDVEDQIERIKDDLGTEGAFEEALKEQGLTLPLLREFIFDSLLEEGIRDEVTGEVTPPESELKAYYKEHLDDFRQTRAQHILVDKESLAGRIADRLHAAPKKQVDDLFAELAKEFSTDTSNANDGGDLGYFKRGDFVPPFERAADRLDIGAVSNPVESEFGFHVIRVTDRRTLTYEQARDQIIEQLGAAAKDQAWQEFVVSAYKQADVEINPRYGELDLESQLVVTPTSDEFPGVEPLDDPRPLESPGD